MAKYLHKNTRYYDTIDPKRTIKMSSKVLHAGWGPTACRSMKFAGPVHFKFATRVCDRKAQWENNFT